MKNPLANHIALAPARSDARHAGRQGTLPVISRAILILVFAFATAARMDAQTPADAGVSRPATPSPEQSPPESRGERLKHQREEKAKNLAPPKQNRFELYAINFDRKGSNSIEDVNFWGFHPRLDWIARGSGAAPGVRYWKPEAIGPIDVMGSAFYSWRRYEHFDMQIGLIPNRGKRIPPRKFEIESVDDLGDIEKGKFSRFKLYSSGLYRDRTDESYYGSGPDSSRSDLTHYRIKDTLFEAVVGYQISRRMGFTYKAGLLNHSLAPGRSSPHIDPSFETEQFPGNSNPPNYFRSHLSFLFDFMDDPSLPHRGLKVYFGWEKYDNVDTRNMFNFNRLEIDSRGYIPLGSNQRVLALRAAGINADPAPGNNIPFFLQPSLGGGESLRGFDAFRFQGDKMLLLQGEYRWEPSRRLELAFFGDTGTVADQGTRLSINKMKSDAGFGLRFKSSRTTLFRLDIARSNEGVYFQFRFSPAF